MKTINVIIATLFTLVGLMCCSISTILFSMGVYDILLEYYLTIAKDEVVIVWIILITGLCSFYLAKLVGEQ